MFPSSAGVSALAADPRARGIATRVCGGAAGSETVPRAGSRRLFGRSWYANLGRSPRGRAGLFESPILRGVA
jgi:hypothetical protein